MASPIRIEFSGVFHLVTS